MMYGIYSEVANEQRVAACVMEKLYLASDSLVVFCLSLLVLSPSGSIFILVCYVKTAGGERLNGKGGCQEEAWMMREQGENG